VPLLRRVPGNWRRWDSSTRRLLDERSGWFGTNVPGRLEPRKGLVEGRVGADLVVRRPLWALRRGSEQFGVGEPGNVDAAGLGVRVAGMVSAPMRQVRPSEGDRHRQPGSVLKTPSTKLARAAPL
jgi:hypothetical protein